LSHLDDVGGEHLLARKTHAVGLLVFAHAPTVVRSSSIARSSD
jgi:hypothetical protein